MKKAVKCCICTAVTVALALFLLFLLLPLWVAPVATPIANSVVPGIVKTSFTVGKIACNQYTGKISVENLLLSNPEGFDEPVAADIRRASVAVDMSTVFSETVVIDDISIDGVFVSYVFNKGKDNFTAISERMSDGGDEEGDAASDEASDIPSDDGETGSGDEIRIIIRKLTINDAKFRFGKITMPLPQIVLTDIGEKSGGVTMSELLELIVNALIKTLGSIGDGASALAAVLGEGALEIGGETGKALGDVSGFLKKSGEAISSGVNSEGGVKAVGEEVKRAADLFKSLFK